jgi:hypothetical protein
MGMTVQGAGLYRTVALHNAQEARLTSCGTSPVPADVYETRCERRDTEFVSALQLTTKKKNCIQTCSPVPHLSN